MFRVSDPEVTLPNINKPWSNSLGGQEKKKMVQNVLQYFCERRNGQVNAIHEDNGQGNGETDI